MSMKIKVLSLALVCVGFAFSQSNQKREKFPSYFGLQVKPVFPTQFIGTPSTTFSNGEFSTTVSQKMGYSFGGTVRAGFTKLLAFETGLNFTQRNFGIDMSIADSNVFATNSISFIQYDMPLNLLVYVQMSERFYMNASLGPAITFKPTDVGVLTKPGGLFTFTHTGVVRKKAGIELNANFGFEFRTDKIGFFYLGGSGRIPIGPVFDMVAKYEYQGIKKLAYSEIDGSYLSLDFKYFFPNIRNSGVQFQNGPIL